MTITIKRPEADQLVRELVKLTRRSMTEVIVLALKEMLLREQGKKATSNLSEELMAVGKRCASLPDLDDRTPEQILGYNDIGMPRK